MKRLLVLLSILWVALSVHASTFVMGQNQALGSQPGWFLWVSGTDSPEGAFMATLKPSSNSVTGVIPLGTTIGSGTHYLALKVYDYHQDGSIIVDFGGASKVVTNLVPGGTTGWWTVPVAIVTSIATNSIRITMQRTTTNTFQQIYLQRGVFISDVTNTIVTSQDVVLNLNVPSIDPSAEIKGNQIDNSGFEVGLGSGWGSQEATARPFPIKTLLDTTISHDGTNSVKLPNLYQIVSPVYRLRGNRKYTFSAWVSNAVSGHVTLTMANVTPSPTGYPPTSSLATSIAVAQGAWRRVSIATNLLAYPTGDFQFRILGNDPTGGYTWIDSVQVEEGDLTAWAPRMDIELGLNTMAAANVFTNGESATYSIKVRNNNLISTNVSVIDSTYDYFNSLLESVTNAVTVPASSTYTLNRNLPAGPFLAALPSMPGAVYYIATNGLDANPGTLASPWLTWQKAANVVNPGDTVNVLPGTYTPTSIIGRGVRITRSGTSVAPIVLQGYGGRPVFDCSAVTNHGSGVAGFVLVANWWRVRGIDVTSAGQYPGALVGGTGIILSDASNNIFENVRSYGHTSTAFYIGDDSASHSSNNLFLNCDAWDNHDVLTGGNNADGFDFRGTGAGNVADGCRAWHNADDGFDLFHADSAIIIRNSWAFYNGYDVNGNGMGFKLGNSSGSARPRHYVHNNVAFNNKQIGFDSNESLGTMDIFNNTAYNNGLASFAFAENVPYHLRNNIGILSPNNPALHANVDDTFNSWNLAVTASASDFVTVNTNLATADRNTDGTLPSSMSTLFRLAAGSDLIDKGTDVGLPFLGSAPDLGAFEYGSVPVGKYGIHRVFAYVDGHQNTMDEMLFHKQPSIQLPGAVFSSNFGTHTDFTDLEFGTAKKLGVNWDRTVSSGSYFRWTLAEPSDDAFVYFDTDVAKAASNGIDILGALGVFWPTWADNGAGVPKLDKWTNFVQTIVRHYKPVVHYWEIWNEPQYAFTPAVYGNMLRGAVERIRIEDPTAKIVAFGGVTDYTYASQVFAYLGGSPSDWGEFASAHQYPLFSPTSLLNFYNFVTVTNGLPSWNTETGAWSRGYYFGNNSDFIGYDEYAWPHLASYRYQFGGRGVSELLLQNVIRTIGTGYQKYFQYDSRIYVGPGLQDTHPTWYDYDDSVRPHGAAYGVFAGMFDYAKGVGQVINTTTTTAYMYQRGTAAFATVWGTGSRSLVVPLTDSQLSVYDIMGNTNAFGGVLRFGSSPVYLKGLGITTNTLRLALQANSSVASPDVTPPNLSITQWPTGPTTNQPVYLRWLAVDDISLPSSAEPNAITYTYRLDSPTVLGTWAPWTAGTTVALSGLTNDVYTFNVLCQDAAGNSIATSVPITIGFNAPIPPPPPPDETGPLLQLEFDTTVGGTTPNIGSANLTAALTAGAVLGVGHGAGASLSLDGLISYVVVVPTGALNFGPTNSFTASAWVKTPVNRAVTSPILTSQGLFSLPGYTMVILNHKNARFSARLRDTAGHDTGYIQNFNGVFVNEGSWHHVVLVVDRSIQKMALFTDTVKSALTDITNIGDLSNQMGVFLGGPVFHYKGNIDGIRVYGRALSDADVIALP